MYLQQNDNLMSQTGSNVGKWVFTRMRPTGLLITQSKMVKEIGTGSLNLISSIITDIGG